jgi:AcrR family transcriptional regulator
MPRPPTDQKPRLLAAATRVFAERGYREASVREICSKADANIAMIKYYFGSKEELYLQVVMDAFEGLIARHPIPEIPKEASGAEALRRLIRWLVGMILAKGKDRDLTRLTMREFQDPSPVLGDIVKRTAMPVQSVAVEVLDRVLPSGTPLEVKVRAFGLLMALCTQYETSGPLLERLGMPMPSTDAEVEAHADAVSTFALAGLRALAAQGA